MPLQLGYAPLEPGTTAAARTTAEEANYERQQVLGVVVEVLATFGHGEHHGTFCLLLIARLTSVVIVVIIINW